MTKTLSLFGLPLVDTDRPAAISAMLDSSRRITAAFLNAHCVNSASRDATYKRALRAADYVLPDGSGISLAAKMVGKRLTANLNGTDLCRPLCEEAARRGLSIFLLGAKPGIAERAARNMTAKVPGLRIAGHRDGYFEDDASDAVVCEVNESGADIVMVAMGVPLQDVWIYRHRRQMNAKLVMGVGALFDFEAGAVERAPKVIRKLGLEWTWRLAMEPRRMAGRYLVGNFTFVARAMWNAARTPSATAQAMPRSKRALDIALASTALFTLAPALAASAIAVKTTSRGSVLYRQKRVGLNGETFEMLKFRSMHTNADANRASLLKNSDRDSICFKMKKDPRLTPIGNFIRRYSIDELPQLWNVLKGDMSIVGPRPALPEEVAAYPTPALRRLAGVPGITGLWQVSGRAEIGFERMVAMDIAYLRSKSLLLDLLLIGLTARAVIGGRGAY